MNSLLAILLRVAIVYVYLLVVVRLSGKRTIAEGTPFDLVVALIISDLPDDVIWGQVPVAQGIVAISIIMLVHLLVVYGAFHSPHLDRLFNSIASPFLKQGAPVEKNLAFERESAWELDAMLREAKIDRREDAQEARLEPSGSLTVQRTPEAQYAEKRDAEKLREVLE